MIALSLALLAVTQNADTTAPVAAAETTYTIHSAGLELPGSPGLRAMARGTAIVVAVGITVPSLVQHSTDLVAGHWHALVGVASNRSAIGARVLVRAGGRTTAQAVVSQSSFYSANDPRLHFGLGPNRTADVDVVWPNGRRDTFKGLAANQLVTIKEGTGVVPNNGWA